MHTRTRKTKALRELKVAEVHSFFFWKNTSQPQHLSLLPNRCPSCRKRQLWPVAAWTQVPWGCLLAEDLMGPVDCRVGPRWVLRIGSPDPAANTLDSLCGPRAILEHFLQRGWAHCPASGGHLCWRYPVAIGGWEGVVFGACENNFQNPKFLSRTLRCNKKIKGIHFTLKSVDLWWT